MVRKRVSDTAQGQQNVSSAGLFVDSVLKLECDLYFCLVPALGFLQLDSLIYHRGSLEVLKRLFGSTDGVLNCIFEILVALTDKCDFLEYH